MWRRAIGVVLAGALASGCATGGGGYPLDGEVRALDHAPLLLSQAVAPDRSGACQSPVRDPNANLTLTLVRSSSGLGDYRPAPVDAYGLRVTELLRVDCRSGRVLGAVRA